MLRNFETVRPIKTASKVAQDLKEKSHESLRNEKKKYPWNLRGGGFRPPAFLGLGLKLVYVYACEGWLT